MLHSMRVARNRLPFHSPTHQGPRLTRHRATMVPQGARAAAHVRAWFASLDNAPLKGGRARPTVCMHAAESGACWAMGAYGLHGRLWRQALQALAAGSLKHTWHRPRAPATRHQRFPPAARAAPRHSGARAPRPDGFVHPPIRVRGRDARAPGRQDAGSQGPLRVSCGGLRQGCCSHVARNQAHSRHTAL